MDEITHLNWWTLNAKKWREAHGFITPEWMQYRENMYVKNIWSAVISFLLGIAVGVAMCIS
jgi:hypothetical protein